MKNMTRWLAATLVVLALPSRASQYTDLWFNPQESGWGMNVVQQLETAFVTLFVYGTDGKPTWYVASDARVIAYAAGGLPVFAGTLYRTQGPWHGGPFDASKFNIAPVGTITMEALAIDRMRVQYTADGVGPITREVVRMTWQFPLVGANYAAQFVMREALAGQAPYGTRLYQADVLLHFEDSQAFMRVDDHLGVRCEYRGPFVQSGKIARASGTFTCNGGDARSGTFEISDFEVSAHGVTGYLRTFAASRNSYGRFAAARY